MAKRKYTTVSLSRETYETGSRFMKEHGYASWEALIRGLVSGHRFARGESVEIDIGPLARLMRDHFPATHSGVKAENPVVAGSTPGGRPRVPNPAVLSLVCDRCKSRFDMTWDPSEPADMLLVTQICKTRSWTCTDCVSLLERQQRDQRIIVEGGEREANLTRKPESKRLLLIVGPNSKYRFERLQDSDIFESRSFRIRALPNARDHRAIVACPNGYWDEAVQACHGRMIVQAILHPKSEKSGCPQSLVWREVP